jgi:hypothetical protein
VHFLRGVYAKGSLGSKRPMVGILTMWKFTGLLFLLCACHDAGRDTLDSARGRYQTLRDGRVPMQSHDYDAVLSQLASIPNSSRAKADARALGAEIEKGRAVVPPGPADPPGSQAQSELDHTRAECERLRAEAKSLTLAARTKKQEVLDACERRLAELEGPRP